MAKIFFVMSQLVNFYQNHPKLLILTLILALYGLFGIFQATSEIIIMINQPCDDLGTMSLWCYLTNDTR